MLLLDEPFGMLDSLTRRERERDELIGFLERQAHPAPVPVLLDAVEEGTDAVQPTAMIHV